MRRAPLSFLPATLLAALIAAPGATRAADEPGPLVTDRPDRTESTAIVTPGFAQLEIGWTHVELDDDAGGGELDSFPQLLARVGMTRRIELRLGFDGYELHGDDAGHTSTGVKIYLAGESGARPELAVLAGASLPTGNRELYGDKTDPFAALLGSYTLADRLSLGTNLGVAWQTTDVTDKEDTTRSRGFWTASLGIGLSDRWSSFVELFGDVALSEAGPAQNGFDMGVTFLVRPNLQLDLSAGFPIADSDEDWSAGIGVSWRLPG